MRTNSEIKRSARITGLVLGTLYGLLLVMSATMKLLHVPDAVTVFLQLG